QRHMLDAAAKTRAILTDLTAFGFVLDNEISLGGSGSPARNYELGTIAHFGFDIQAIPPDDRMNELLDAVIKAYDLAIDVPLPSEPLKVPEVATPTAIEIYTIEDALSELFLEQSALERLLSIWRTKKNLILQGAPGVGKSFVAKRLAC